jgi:hypothetical protein
VPVRYVCGWLEAIPPDIALTALTLAEGRRYFWEWDLKSCRPLLGRDLLEGGDTMWLEACHICLLFTFDALHPRFPRPIQYAVAVMRTFIKNAAAYYPVIL